MPCPGWKLSVKEDASLSKTDASGSGIDGNIFIQLPLPPGSLTEIWKSPQGRHDIYHSSLPGYFSTFDAGSIDADGFVFVMARTDDIINVAGHRLSTGQMEGCLASHDAVAECAVIGVHCALKGERPVGFVVLKAGCSASAAELSKHVREHVGPIAVISVTVVEALPKTRSGKILRKTLRSVANKDASIAVPPTIEDVDVLPKIWAAFHREPMPRSTLA
jgi:propionyl-CoA synthetase